MMTNRYKYDTGEFTSYPIFTATIGDETYNVYFTDFTAKTCAIYRVTTPFPEFISIEPSYEAPATLKALTKILKRHGVIAIQECDIPKKRR